MTTISSRSERSQEIQQTNTSTGRGVSTDRPDPAAKYRRFPKVGLSDRIWPSAELTEPPIWCSVDLRDGNQALINPMGLKEKLRFFQMLVDMGFKEIEIGFPSASGVEYDFTRHLIDNGLIPEDVTIQVLCQCREELILRTFEAISGVPNAIVHIYNSTSPIQRQVVFQKEKDEIVELARKGTELVKRLARTSAGTKIKLEYSPESFSGTELEFAVDICARVMDVWEPDPNDPIILNLPATVEMSTPSTFADQVELFARRLPNRDTAVISVHPHNDRGTAVAAAELAVMAGADRIEGTLFGNGERTGNVDLITLALNMWTQGVDPGLDISNIHEIKKTSEDLTRLPVHPRHPYAGDLVFTAFSGSHQDAISKVLRYRHGRNDPLWDVPYLPLDPSDIGRSFDGTIRINSQSGKGGISYILEETYGYKLPYRLQIEFAQIAQAHAEETGGELAPLQIWELFEDEYFSIRYDREIQNFHVSSKTDDRTGVDSVEIAGDFSFMGRLGHLSGLGESPADAFIQGLRTGFGLDLQINDYTEQSVGHGNDNEHVVFIELIGSDATCYGGGRDVCPQTASLRAVVSALYRLD